eukprot:136338_1
MKTCVTKTLDRAIIQSELATTGYCLFKNTNYSQNILNDSTSELTIHHLNRSLFGDNYNNSIVNYKLGTDDRSEFRNSLLNVSMTSNSLYIPPHNELLYTDQFPRILAFICVKPPKIAGQTPLTNSVSVWNDMNENLKQKFTNLGIRYVQNLVSVSAEHNKDKKTWNQLFNTNDKSKVEHLCNDVYGHEFEWKLDAMDNTEILRIMYTKPAIVEYDNGIISFANSITGLHGQYFDTGYNDYYKGIDLIDRPTHSQWGNGKEFNGAEMIAIRELFDENTIMFDWEEGDILIIDNLMWAHSRMPFEGDRLIFAMMGVPYVRKSKTNPFLVCSL